MMKKQYSYLLLLLSVVLLFACKKEDTPDASPSQTDPFARKDNPASAADHQIYQLYQETGVPVLYSDTVSANPLTLLNIGYHLTNFDSTLHIKYLQRSEDVLAGVEFVKSQVLPYLGGKLKPYSVLLTDSITGTVLITNGNIRTLVKMVFSAYPSLNTLALSKVANISNMAPDTLALYKKDIFKSLLQPRLAEQDNLLKDFYAVSAAFYGKYAYGDGSISGYIAYAPRETYGLVALTPTPAGYYATGTQVDDVNGYFDVVLSLTKDQFTAKYSNYPLVMNKYDLFVKALTTLGFKMP